MVVEARVVGVGVEKVPAPATAQDPPGWGVAGIRMQAAALAKAAGPVDLILRGRPRAPGVTPPVTPARAMVMPATVRGMRSPRRRPLLLMQASRRPRTRGSAIWVRL